MDQTPTQELYNGFGDTLARGVELAVTPALFALLGHFIDGKLHTGVAFMVGLLLFCVVGMSVKMYYGYVEAMKAHEARGAWSRKGQQ